MNSIEIPVNHYYEIITKNSVNETIDKTITEWSINQFNSISSLNQYVENTLLSILSIKNQYISRIKNSHLPNKLILINTIEKEYQRNLSINLQCYKVLHLLIYNYITFGKLEIKELLTRMFYPYTSFQQKYTFLENELYNFKYYLHYTFFLYFKENESSFSLIKIQGDVVEDVPLIGNNLYYQSSFVQCQPFDHQLIRTDLTVNIKRQSCNHYGVVQISNRSVLHNLDENIQIFDLEANHM